MQGLADLAESERGVWCLLLLFIITCMVVVRLIDAAAWIAFVLQLSGMLVASKTVTTAVDQIKKKPQSSEAS